MQPDLLVAITGLLAPLGAGVAWLFKKVEKRFEKIERALEECEKRDKQNREKLTIFDAALVLLLQELEAIQPLSRALAQAKGLLQKTAAAPKQEDTSHAP